MRELRFQVFLNTTRHGVLSGLGCSPYVRFGSDWILSAVEFPFWDGPFSAATLPEIAILAKRLELYEVVSRVSVHCVPNFEWLLLLLLKIFEIILGVRALLRVSWLIPLHTN